MALANASTVCCSQLSQTLGPLVSFPGSSTYNATERSYTSLQEVDLIPKCIVKPETAQDVATAVSIIAGVADCQFAIKGHGHAPAAGFANIDGGVTVDMTGLNSTTVSADHGTAHVEAGSRWVDVYAYLDPLNLTVAGGRNGNVGVGGFTLGGGISYFAPQVGWACDTVVNFEIVLASGDLVNANETCHPDLFRALKGGSNNFGIVTRFDYSTLQQGAVFGGSLVQSINDRTAVFKAFADIANAPEYDIYASIVTGLLFNSTARTWTLSSTPIYTKPISNPPVYGELFSIPNVTSTLEIRRLSTFSNETELPALNVLYYTGTYGVSAEFLDQFFDICNSTIFEFDVPSGVLWSIALEPLPTAIVKHGAGQNVLGTSPADGNGMVILFAALWPDTASNDVVMAKGQELLSNVNRAAESMGLLHSFQYLNYAQPPQDPPRSYGDDNFEFLRRTSLKYDPLGLFQNQVPGGFKLR